MCTGAGNAVLSLADALRRRGHTVETLLREDVPAWASLGRSARLAFPMVSARRVVRQAAKYDVVVIHEPSAAAYTLARKWNSALPPCVVMSHGVEQRCWDLNGEMTLRTLKTRVLHPLTELGQANYSLRHADAVVCLSSDDARYLEHPLGVPAARIHRMHNGVDAELFRANWNVSAEPKLLFVGSWIPRKGTREFVQALRELRRSRPGLRATILGSGLSPDVIRGEFAPEDRMAVDILKSVDREELPALLACDQIYVLPSHFEGMPLTLLEAMAAGLPCVTTNICGMRDVIIHGENGVLVAPGEAGALTRATSDLLDSSPLRLRLGAAARRSASALTWERAAVAWELLLASTAPKSLDVPRMYDHWHDEVAERDNPESDLNNPWHRFARAHLDGLRGHRVLEAACGRGQFSVWLRKQGAWTSSVDFSLGALRHARRRLDSAGGDGCVICGDAEQLPLPSQSMDWVVSCETLEHVPHPPACLRELRRVLRTGGRLILTTENYLNIWGLYRLYIAFRARRYNSGDCPQPIEQWMFSPRTRRMIRKAGFRILRTDGEGHHLMLWPGVNPPELEAQFLSRVPALRRTFRYLARHFFVVAEAV